MQLQCILYLMVRRNKTFVGTFFFVIEKCLFINTSYTQSGLMRYSTQIVLNHMNTSWLLLFLIVLAWFRSLSCCRRKRLTSTCQSFHLFYILQMFFQISFPVLYFALLSLLMICLKGCFLYNYVLKAIIWICLFSVDLDSFVLWESINEATRWRLVKSWLSTVCPLAALCSG